jgi:hypothetical protein
MTQRRIPIDNGLRHLHRFIRGIVQHLDIELVLGIVDLADGFHQAVHHELLVVNRELDGHARKVFKLCRWLCGPVLAVAIIHPNQRIPMHAVTGQDHHHNEIRNEQRQIKAVRGVKTFEGPVHELTLEIMDDSPL